MFTVQYYKPYTHLTGPAGYSLPVPGQRVSSGLGRDERNGKTHGQKGGCSELLRLQQLDLVRVICKRIIPDSKEGRLAFLSSLKVKIFPLGNSIGVGFVCF